MTVVVLCEQTFRNANVLGLSITQSGFTSLPPQVTLTLEPPSTVSIPVQGFLTTGPEGHLSLHLEDMYLNALH